MSNEIKAAIRATLAALKAELATGNNSAQLRALSEKAIKAAEKVVGTQADASPAQDRTK